MGKQAKDINLLEYLQEVAEQVSRRRFGEPRKIFELAKTGKYPQRVAELAESFGMMIVKVEAREYRLEKNLEKLNLLNEQLKKQVTKYQKIAAELKESQEKYQAILKNSVDGIILLRNEKIEFCNNTFLEQFGFDNSKEALGFSFRELIVSEDHNKCQEYFAALRSEKRPHKSLKIGACCKDGSKFRIEICAEYIQFQGDQAIQATLHDITKTEQLERELRQSQKLESIGLLASGIAHDFNNLLAIINGYTELLLHDADFKEPECEYVEEIHGAGQQATQLIKQLMMFSRKQLVTPQPLQISKVVADSYKMLKRLIGEDIQFILRNCSSDYYIRADTSQIEQILFNLVLNARDAIHQHPDSAYKKEIIIELKKSHPDDPTDKAGRRTTDRDFLLLSVRDTGIGMDAEIQAKIFDPFFTTKDTARGTGLGLSMVYGIVKQNRGVIKIDSTPLKGTQFNIYWPLDKKPVYTSRSPRIPLAKEPGNETILVVEDDDGVRHVAELILTSLGYRVHSASNASEAIKLAKSLPSVDLLFTDVVMPGKDGVQLAYELKRHLPNLKILFTSGYTDDRVSFQEIKANKFHFIKKPFSSKSIAQKIREVFND